jgi:hypothetical protein
MYVDAGPLTLEPAADWEEGAVDRAPGDQNAEV